MILEPRVNYTFRRIDFHFRTAVDAAPVLAATWIKNDDKAHLEVVNQVAYNEMTALHDKVCDGMQKPEHHWANTFPGN